MLKKFTAAPRIGKRIKRNIKFLLPLKGGEWDCKDLRVSQFKKRLKIVLRHIQNDCCAYCGLALYETSQAEIEHIAPKGGPKIPQHFELAFTPFNLCLACNYCNGPSKKGKKKILSQKHKNYSKCVFKIIHPHFDDPDDHLEWTGIDEGTKILVMHRTDKGKEHIEMFKLDGEKMTVARASKQMYEDKLATMAVNYRP